jgi:hypothetical protein
MNEANANPPAPGPGGQGEGWSRQRWLTMVAVVFAAQVAIIFALGEKHFPPQRQVINVPQIALADSADEWITLNDPTLFVLPHAGDFPPVAGGPMSPATQPSFRWKEPPGELSLPAGESLGAVFTRFMQTNPFATPSLDFKPPAKLSEPVLTLPPVFAGNSMLRFTGELAQRKWLNPVSLTNWPYAEVIAPSRVQVLVGESGDVVSAVLLPPDNSGEVASHYEDADKSALESARTARFSPASHPSIGQLIFNWRTVPPPATNSAASTP